MALYTDGRRFLVKFPDGRMVKFPTRPSIKQLKEKNYPVPAAYWRWTLIKQSEISEEKKNLDDRKPPEVEIPCDQCDGTGWKLDSAVEIECDACDGTGIKQD
jgi:hypothetical protein